MSDELVKIEVTGDAIWIRSGFSEFRLSAEDQRIFPVANAEDEELSCAPDDRISPGDSTHDFATDSESTVTRPAASCSN
ncbi:MAG: hypothetical protein U0872_05505 [Planctomycetaceae bacterium]